MADSKLSQLEGDVEAARAKLAEDLSTLRSPSVWVEFTDGVKQETLKAKDALIESVRSTTQSKVQDIVEDLKAKAAANPSAVLAIGAGLAWRFLRRPPIATALVGAGIFGLMRTPRPELGPDADRFAFAQQRLKEQASDLGKKASDLAVDAAETAKERAAELTAAAADKVDDFGRAAAYREQAPDPDFEPTPSQQDERGQDQLRDSILLGVAGLAIAAAFGLAYQRRDEDRAEFG
jgi:hypothetical protein